MAAASPRSATGPNRSSMWVRTWWRRTCGTATSVTWMWWHYRTRTTTISAACRRWFPIFARANCGPAQRLTAPPGASRVALVSDFRPRELGTGATLDSPAWRVLRDRAQRLGVKIMPLLAPQRFAWGGAQIEILAPFADYVPAGEPTNDDS